MVERWQGETIRAGALTTSATPKERQAEVIAGSPCRDLETHLLADRRRWDADGIVGDYASTTFCSPAALGERRQPFERELRATLRRLAPGGTLVEEGRLRALLAWKA